jgi:hypothetical protein
MSEPKYAGMAALVLSGAAALIVLVIHPGGFEGQIGWAFGLLPGAIVGAAVADRVYKIAPVLESITYWSLTLGAGLLWYFVLSYFVIKTYRFVSSRF